jgi:hypothetical protein
LVASDPPFEVFWRKDSRYFAIKYAEARGWVTGAIYGRDSKGRWIEVEIPKEDYVNAIKKMSGVSELLGKGCERPVAWTKKGELVLQFVDRNITYGQQDFEKEFRVTLSASNWLGQPLKTAKILSIMQRSEEETNRDLQAR